MNILYFYINTYTGVSFNDLIFSKQLPYTGECTSIPHDFLLNSYIALVDTLEKYRESQIFEPLFNILILGNNVHIRGNILYGEYFEEVNILLRRLFNLEAVKDRVRLHSIVIFMENFRKCIYATTLFEFVCFLKEVSEKVEYPLSLRSATHKLDTLLFERLYPIYTQRNMEGEHIALLSKDHTLKYSSEKIEGILTRYISLYDGDSSILGKLAVINENILSSSKCTINLNILDLLLDYKYFAPIKNLTLTICGLITKDIEDLNIYNTTPTTFNYEKLNTTIKHELILLLFKLRTSKKFKGTLKYNECLFTSLLKVYLECAGTVDYEPIVNCVYRIIKKYHGLYRVYLLKILESKSVCGGGSLKEISESIMESGKSSTEITQHLFKLLGVNLLDINCTLRVIKINRIIKGLF